MYFLCVPLYFQHSRQNVVQPFEGISAIAGNLLLMNGVQVYNERQNSMLFMFNTLNIHYKTLKYLKLLRFIQECAIREMHSHVDEVEPSQCLRET